jgi:phospholipid transport system substrate-binding protein
MALLAAVPVLAAAASGSAARQVVETTLSQVIAILNDTSASESDRRDRIADIAYERFDFDTMSKLVIARPWRKFTVAEREEFIAEFKTHLARSYGRRLSRYEGINVKVVSEVVEPRGDVTVRTQVVGGQFDGAEMSYRMRDAKSQWLAIDVVIEGVSLVSNFRSQFKPILSDGGAPELLRRLKDKNDVLQKEIAREESASAPRSASAVSAAPADESP